MAKRMTKIERAQWMSRCYSGRIYWCLHLQELVRMEVPEAMYASVLLPEPTSYKGASMMAMYTNPDQLVELGSLDYYLLGINRPGRN